MRVKICGITNYSDAMQAVEAGADALGFVFYQGSPRYITPENAKKIIDRMPPFVGRVGLFVNEEVETIETISSYCNLTSSQIHFEVDDKALEMIGKKALPVIRAKESRDLLRYCERYRLVDVYCKEYGGSGRRLNLEWFEGVDCSKIILAGGLTPENLHELKKYNFYGVDVSSGVERLKGRKDHDKVSRFIRNAKSL